MGLRRHFVLATLVAALAATGTLIVPTKPAAAATGPSTSNFEFADPAVYQFQSPWGPIDITYGTSTWASGCSQAFYWVPYFIGQITGKSCPDGDAFPTGPNALGGGYEHPPSNSPFDGVWAPDVERLPNGTYVLYYSYKVAASVSQRCIARAFHGDNPLGPFGYENEFACAPGPNGRDAIDPSVFREGANTYVAYRDDYAASPVQDGSSAISVVPVDATGEANFGALRKLVLDYPPPSFLSIPWTHCGNNVYIVENPEIVKKPDGRYGLFFSGNCFYNVDYGIGLADCGTQLIGVPGLCTMYNNDGSKPVFAHSSKPRYANMPFDWFGPGALSVDSSNDVRWAAFSYGPARRTFTGSLTWAFGFIPVIN